MLHRSGVPRPVCYRPAVTISRAKRASKSSLLGTFSLLVLLLLVARFALLQCRARPAKTPASLPSAQLPPSKPPAESQGDGGAAPLRGTEASISSSVHVALGTPRDADPLDEYFIDQRAFVLSYSPEKRVANWVAWQLDRKHLGHVRRRDDFRADLALPARFYRVKESDYLHSGYDRGHLCPSADRQHSAEDNSRTFLFTNIEPQLHELNAGPWEQLERYARERARAGALLFIVAGGLFSAPFPTIGNGVAVPAASFKIIVVLESGQAVNDVNESSEVLAVLMPNQPGVGDRDWMEYGTTVDAIEQASGYDFLNAVPERVQRVIEARTLVAPERRSGRRAGETAR